MDGHVHITNRVYWEKDDFWQPQPGNWDYRCARDSGVNCIVDNLGTYGAWNYNYTPKLFLRLIETALRYAEQHANRSGRRLLHNQYIAAGVPARAQWTRTVRFEHRHRTLAKYAGR
jgi:hypothetical protein